MAFVLPAAAVERLGESLRSGTNSPAGALNPNKAARMEEEGCREGAARPHINPRFSPRKGGAPPGPRVHINPKFARRGVVSTSSLSPQVHRLLCLFCPHELNT